MKFISRQEMYLKHMELLVIRNLHSLSSPMQIEIQIIVNTTAVLDISFADIETKANINDAFSSSDNTGVIDLASNDVVGVETEDGVKDVFEVNDILTGTTGYI
ncbi:MAG: hypothetical protein R6U04_13625 [Bacteroidales bacterium]